MPPSQVDARRENEAGVTPIRKSSSWLVRMRITSLDATRVSTVEIYRSHAGGQIGFALTSTLACMLPLGSPSASLESASGLGSTSMQVRVQGSILFGHRLCAPARIFQNHRAICNLE